ncbi:signal peptide peptidase-domain-containing protein [Hypoxylon sp. FL0890]|nr:signal peptide peptidase-domain-containing protein [Hypoxylon sp. FL0890]
MATNDSILLAASEISATNMTESLVANLTFTEKLASLPAYVWDNRDLFILESRIIFTSLALIYLGAHAALRRPPSANPPKKSKKGQEQRGRDEDREDQYVHGLMPSDAILLPILAGVVLVGLYYLIKWLEDPYLLNKILRVYFSFMSLASMGKLFADLLHFLTGFVFPTVWRARDGKLYHIDSSKRGQWSIQSNSADQVWDNKKNTPLPGWGSEWKLSNATNTLLWEIRQLLLEQWTVRLAIHGIANETFKVKFNDILGVVLGVGVNLIYYITQSTFLSNVMGYAFSYTSIIIMSPTAFATGTAVLFGLFFYDIYMVFFTPYMVTVATSLDVPIKLVFEGPTKASMLGLGDIVLPGIFVALCLRFDQYMYYYRQRKLVPVELKSEDKSSGQLVTNTQTQRMVIKPDYVDPQGKWGDRFWSTTLSKMLSPDATPALKASAFPRTYFHAAMIGYFLAIVMTLIMLLVYHHAQPALLYLVPGVVFTVWTTGMMRGELREMWNYTEDGSLDTADTIVEVDGNGNVIDVTRNGTGDNKVNNKPQEKQTTEIKDGKTRNADLTDQKNPIPDEVGEKAREANCKRRPSRKEKSYPVFLFSIEAPTSDRDGDS